MGDIFRDMEYESRRKTLDDFEAIANAKKQADEDGYLSFFVSGIPLAQGRPRFKRVGKFTKTYDPTESKSWKESVRWQCIEFMRKERKEMIDGAIEASLVFLLPRPKSLPKKTKHHLKKPDVDNLCKSIFDALQGIAFKSDSQIYKMTVTKLYETKIPGVSIILMGE